MVFHEFKWLPSDLLAVELRSNVELLKTTSVLFPLGNHCFTLGQKIKLHYLSTSVTLIYL